MLEAHNDRGYKKLKDITDVYEDRWFNHYSSYLSTLVFQLFKWNNLPDTVDPRFIEMTLHRHGQVAFHRDKLFGYIALQGTPAGKQNHYNVMEKFNATTSSSENITRDFYIYHYLNQDEILGKKDKRDYGVLIQNNDYAKATMEAVRLYAADLAELKGVIRTNLLAQKTPVILTGEGTNQLTIKNIYNKIEGNVPVILTDKHMDLETFKTHLTPAPFVADKVNQLKNAIWGDFMTFLGINNSNIDKKERLITDEANSNNDQISASGNIMLKAREEACERINWLYPDLNVSVEMRHDVLELMRNEVDNIGNVYNAPNEHYPDVHTKQ